MKTLKQLFEEINQKAFNLESSKEIYTRESNELLQYTNNSNINYDIDLNDLVKAFQ